MGIVLLCWERWVFPETWIRLLLNWFGIPSMPGNVNINEAEQKTPEFRIIRQHFQQHAKLMLSNQFYNHFDFPDQVSQSKFTLKIDKNKLPPIKSCHFNNNCIYIISNTPLKSFYWPADAFWGLTPLLHAPHVFCVFWRQSWNEFPPKVFPTFSK